MTIGEKLPEADLPVTLKSNSIQLDMQSAAAAQE
jgi:hypothetical protein